MIPERATVVRRIVKDHLRGIGKHGIAHALNTEGVPTFGRAAHWHRSYIDKILTSPALAGTFVPHIEEHRDGKLHRIPQEPVTDYYPRVIDEDAYERLQATVRASPLRGRHANKVMRNVLSGLARCPVCGSTMTRVTKVSKAKGGNPFLVCAKAKVGAGCAYRAVPYAEVEQALFKGHEVILHEMPSPDASVARELSSAEAAVSELDSRMDDLMRPP